MTKQLDTKWTGAVFALVCDNNLNYAANALALELTTKVDVEIHVFIETKPNIDYVIQRFEHPRIVYHHNVLFKNINAEVYDNPRFSRAAWGRIMLPTILGSYKRIIYCDIDVLPGELDPHILEIDLPYGIALVRDESDILSPRNKLPHNHARFRTGEKYYNSGFMIIDPNKWDTADVSANLSKFFKSGDASFAPYVDQDFLNVHFANRIVELSPLYNLQYNSMGLGIIRPDSIAIRHFTVGEKPYYKTSDIASRRNVERGRELYQEILSKAGVDIDGIPERSTSIARVLKSKIRKKLLKLGVKTKKTNTLLKNWQTEHQLFSQYLHEGAAGIFHDKFNSNDILQSQISEFDGFEFYVTI